jgi:serine/threonine protein kinase
MIGTIISHYKIVEKLGEGGMGVVYKAEDTKLDRLVALKFLPENVVIGSDELARFIQEAKAAAALNHPNICTIYGIEESDGKHFIAMEFVDGQTLQEKKASFSFKQALEVGTQIAEGLAAAHEKGIIHRDIKPENIMFRKDGRVQIMDFGLAKLRGASRLTKEGSTVGTAGYMSPEQVQGQDTDHRSDIFSLGVLLYEMLSGQPPFKGVHETAIAYEIVNVDSPPLSSIKPEISPELDAIVLECLEKDPNDRSQSAKQVAVDLKRFKRESSRSRASTMTQARPAMNLRRITQASDSVLVAPGIRRFLPWSLTAIALAITAVVLFTNYSSEQHILPAIQALIASPKGTNFHSFGQWSGPVTVSPDGRMLAFVSATPEGKTMLCVRRLESGDPLLLPGTEGAYYPFWSYDSKWICFFSIATGKLKKVDIAGNPPVTICDAPNSRGGSWGSKDMIVFSLGPASPLSTVSASGGTPVSLTTIDTTRKESSQRWPCFLPDGKHFLYFSRTASFGAEAEGDAIMVGSLDGGPGKLIVNSSSNATYASGYLLFMRGSSVLAQRFDPGEYSTSGDAVTVAEGVINDPGFSLGVFSASQSGILAYQTGVGLAGARMVIVDRQGKALNYIDDIIEHFWMRISPDEHRVVMSVFEPKSRTQNLWMYDLVRGGRTRFTSGLTPDINPVWSPDGKQIAYTAIGPHNMSILRVRPSTGGGNNEELLESKDFFRVTDWSPDGSALCVSQYSGQTQGDISTVLVKGEKKQRMFVQSAYNEDGGRFSPDGRWIAYVSNETGQTEIYIRPYPGPGSAIKVSTGGGTDLCWRRDGRELFYISNDNKMMSVDIRMTASSLESGSVRELFPRTPIMEAYDVFPDGKRFLINRVIEPTVTDPVTIVVNWMQKLKK